MKHQSLLLLFFLLLSCGRGVIYQQKSVHMEELELIIKSDKTVYAVGESINLWVELKNRGSDTLKLNTNFVLHSDLLPAITSKADGEQLFWLPPPFPADINEGSFRMLAPQKSIKHSISGLNRYLSVSQFGGYPDPGNYQIQLEYRGLNRDWRSKKSYNKAWTGHIQSNVLEITIAAADNSM